MYVYVNMCVCKYARVCDYVCVCEYVCVFVCEYVWVCVRGYVCGYVHIYVCEYTHQQCVLLVFLVLLGLELSIIHRG
jgi:hypothetical protein